MEERYNQRLANRVDMFERIHTEWKGDNTDIYIRALSILMTTEYSAEDIYLIYSHDDVSRLVSKWGKA
ncbi:hypothetical protein NXW41_07535 [Bacteroides thetaiotaomicron]|nr:hypothetical protein [Bacteroides thetaiotaomicron]MCS2998240.1 hypothetical protein [Bacteroides thetaiotaomicron]